MEKDLRHSIIFGLFLRDFSGPSRDTFKESVFLAQSLYSDEIIPLMIGELYELTLKEKGSVNNSLLNQVLKDSLPTTKGISANIPLNERLEIAWKAENAYSPLPGNSQHYIEQEAKYFNDSRLVDELSIGYLQEVAETLNLPLSSFVDNKLIDRRVGVMNHFDNVVCKKEPVSLLMARKNRTSNSLEYFTKEWAVMLDLYTNLDKPLKF